MSGINESDCVGRTLLAACGGGSYGHLPRIQSDLPSDRELFGAVGIARLPLDTGGQEAPHYFAAANCRTVLMKVLVARVSVRSRL